MSQDNEALFAVQEAVEKIHKLLEKRFPVAAEKAKKDLEAVRAAKTAKEARESTERFSRVISDISDDSLKEFKVGLEDASKATKTFGEKLADGAKKTVDGMLSTISASIPFVGGLIGLMLGEAIRMMTQSLDLERAGLGEFFRTIGDGQIAHGLDKFRNELELTYPQIIEIFKKYSSGIGLLGGERFLKSVTTLQDEFKKLGYSAAEGAEAMANYAQQNEAYLSRNRLSQTQLDMAFRQNMMSISKFSNILKISREEMEKKRSLEAENSELQLFMSQLSQQQLDSLQNIKAAYGDSAKDMMLSMFRSQKLYGTVDASERYQASRASGTNERFAALYEAFQQGQDVSDPALARQMSEMSDKQLQMAALVGEHTQYKQDEIFNSIVEGNKFLEKIHNTVAANLSPSNDRDVKVGIELENSLPKLVGAISEEVRRIAEAITGISTDITGMDTDEGIKKMTDGAVSAIKWSGNNLIDILGGIKDMIKTIKDVIIKYDVVGSVTGSVSDAADFVGGMSTTDKLLAAAGPAGIPLLAGKKIYEAQTISRDNASIAARSQAEAQTAIARQRLALAESKKKMEEERLAQEKRALADQAAIAAAHKAELQRIADAVEENNRLVSVNNDQTRRGNSTGYVGG